MPWVLYIVGTECVRGRWDTDGEGVGTSSKENRGGRGWSRLIGDKRRLVISMVSWWIREKDRPEGESSGTSACQQNPDSACPGCQPLDCSTPPSSLSSRAVSFWFCRLAHVHRSCNQVSYSRCNPDQDRQRSDLFGFTNKISLSGPLVHIH